MANKRKNLNDKNNNIKKGEASFSEDSFSVEGNTSSASQDILKEIEEIMTEGSYREKTTAPLTTESEEGADAQVFNEVYQKENTKNKKVKIKKAAKKKTYEKTTWAHKMRMLGVLLVLGAFTGSGLGVWYFNSYLRSSVNYWDYVASDFEVSVNEVFKDNDISATDKDKLDWLDNINGRTPCDFTPAENFILAQYNLTQAKTYIIDGVGSVKSTGVTQSIISRKKFNGTYYTFESISPSKISFIDDIILCDVYRGKGEVEIYTSKNTKPTSKDWKYSNKMLEENYIMESGTLPSSITPYIISEKTVIKGTNSKESVIYNEEEETYSFTMKLDPIKSVLNYAKQVKRTGGLGSFPEFENVTFSVVMDGNWNLISFSIKENYSAVKGIRAKCTGVLNYTVTINGEVEMPVA